jgi:hypothetical protein
VTSDRTDCDEFLNKGFLGLFAHKTEYNSILSLNGKMSNKQVQTVVRQVIKSNFSDEIYSKEFLEKLIISMSTEMIDRINKHWPLSEIIEEYFKMSDSIYHHDPNIYYYDVVTREKDNIPFIPIQKHVGDLFEYFDYVYYILYPRLYLRVHFDQIDIMNYYIKEVTGDIKETVLYNEGDALYKLLKQYALEDVGKSCYADKLYIDVDDDDIDDEYIPLTEDGDLEIVKQSWYRYTPIV